MTQNRNCDMARYPDSYSTVDFYLTGCEPRNNTECPFDSNPLEDCICDFVVTQQASKSFSGEGHVYPYIDQMKKYVEGLVRNDQRLKEYLSDDFKIVVGIELDDDFHEYEKFRCTYEPKLYQLFNFGSFSSLCDDYAGDTWYDGYGSVDIAVLENYGSRLDTLYDFDPFDEFVLDSEKWIELDFIPDDIRTQIKDIIMKFPGKGPYWPWNIYVRTMNNGTRKVYFYVDPLDQ